jgi:hypothetical protein
MVTKKIWLVLGLMLALTGCGAAAPKADTRTATPANGFPAAEESSGFGGASADAPSAPPSDRSFSKSEAAPSPPPPAPSQPGATASTSAPPRRSESSREPAPESRPGLGTEWGETRTSRVHDVSFARDSSRPFAFATLNYNDRRGVDAMANMQATREVRRDAALGNGAVTIAIKDASGNPLEAVRVADRTLVVGQAGQRYSIVLTNHTNHRFESVVTVDGLDVINGKSGSLENRGYVLLPFATLEIEGFRQSNAAVAAFRFAAVGESYAAQMGSARNVGVIGIALFSERGDSFVDERELRLRDTASPFPADPRFAQPPRR